MRWFGFTALIVSVFMFPLYAKEIIHIGVLAHKGIESTTKAWTPTAEYLSEQIPEYEFRIVPLKFEQFPIYLRDKKIDFVLTNSAYYVDLESRYGISRIATLKNLGFNGKPQTQFGGVIFTRSDNPSIKSLEDMKGITFAAVDAQSFGGWIMGLRELKEHGITSDRLHTTFYGTHEAVVYAVHDGKAQAGTVRTDTLERMADEGKINLDDYRVINEKNYTNFFYLASTRLYPEWPFATTNHTSGELAEKVAVALISMSPDSEAAKAAKSMGWTIPLDYQSIHECLKELDLGPYENIKKAAMGYFVEKYGLYGIIAAGVLLFFMVLSVYIGRINTKLREAKDELKSINASLEERIAEKTMHLYDKSLKLENAYLDEKYLRTILRTVADVNQILITARTMDELIEKAALRLSSAESFKSAKICVAEEGKLKALASYGIGDEKIVTSLEEEAFAKNKSLMVTVFDDNVPDTCREKAQKYGIKAIYILPLKQSVYTREPVGVLTICTGRESGFSVEEQKMIEELAGDIGFAIYSFGQNVQIEALHRERIQSYRDFIEALVKMIEKRDSYTAGHSSRVSYYASLIAREMGLGDEQIQKIVEAANLHDIGKVVTPDSVLLKPGKLSSLEYELIKEHVAAGHEVLSEVDLYKDLAEMMLYHHERYDGSGYPQGKQKEEIPMAGHILAVADSFDAMTTNRIYKPRKGVKESLEELSSLSGTQYHPTVVDAASRALADIEVDTTINQLEMSMLEEERLSYFFKDRLTKLYNEDYFALVLSGRARHPKPKSFYMISLTNFTRYNKEYGWEGGNRLLSALADYLSAKLGGALMFRIRGDHFVVADFEGDIESILAESLLLGSEVGYKVRYVGTVPDDPSAIDV